MEKAGIPQIPVMTINKENLSVDSVSCVKLRQAVFIEQHSVRNLL